LSRLIIIDFPNFLVLPDDIYYILWIDQNGKWRIRYNSELCSIYTDTDIIETIKISKLRWTRHMRMPEENPVK
jgi:hypothetical protein